MIRAVITDIEGTTTPISFVKEVLFPYAAAHLEAFVKTRDGDLAVGATLDELAALGRAEGLGEDPIAVARALMAEDRKSTPLKRLQGWIWEAGYGDGSLEAVVYPDVVPRLRAWRDAGVKLAVYSSGSVHAQKLLFAHTDQGDLTPLFQAWFDTEVGAKGDADSYLRIADGLSIAPPEALFLSDSPAELSAARAAGLVAVGVARDGAAAGQGFVTSFADVPA